MGGPGPAVITGGQVIWVQLRSSPIGLPNDVEGCLCTLPPSQNRDVGHPIRRWFEEVWATRPGPAVITGGQVIMGTVEIESNWTAQRRGGLGLHPSHISESRCGAPHSEVV